MPLRFDFKIHVRFLWIFCCCCLACFLVLLLKMHFGRILFYSKLRTTHMHQGHASISASIRRLSMMISQFAWPSIHNFTFNWSKKTSFIPFLRWAIKSSIPSNRSIRRIVEWFLKTATIVCGLQNIDVSPDGVSNPLNNDSIGFYDCKWPRSTRSGSQKENTWPFIDFEFRWKNQIESWMGRFEYTRNTGEARQSDHLKLIDTKIPWLCLRHLGPRGQWRWIPFNAINLDEFFISNSGSQSTAFHRSNVNYFPTKIVFGWKERKRMKNFQLNYCSNRR